MMGTGVPFRLELGPRLNRSSFFPQLCDTRGGLFNYNASSTWSQKAIYALADEKNLGNTARGAYGWDSLTWATTAGSTNLTANHTVIAGIAAKDFYLSSLGLSARPISWEDQDDKPPSLITSLSEQKLIPSRSYGYTAGASYSQRNTLAVIVMANLRIGDAPGSLTLGGYDASRRTEDEASFSFDSQVQRQLVVAIQGISVTNSLAESQLVTQGIFALVDSTVPHLWLPEYICKSFEDAFGIQFNPITTLYLVNETQHEALLKQNAEVTFSLATSLNGGSVINITLPYASFDLEADTPLVRSRTRYFPLRRATNEGQYTLGRVLLQEAFITVDFDHNNFSISQAQYTEGTPAHIVATGTDVTNADNNNSNATTSNNPSLVKSTSHTSHGIGPGAIAGIVVAIVLVLLAAGFCLWRFKYRKPKKEGNNQDKAELEDNIELKVIQENYNKRRVSGDSVHGGKKGTDINVKEVVQTPPADAAELEGAELFSGPSRAQRSLDQLHRAELPSPDPSRPELESPGFDLIRSELSTPEPPSELSTADRSLVPELYSRDIPQELSGSNRNSRARPGSFRHDSLESDVVSPQDSASVRPRHGRKGSDETLPTPVSPQPQPPPQRPSLGHNQRRHSGFRRPPHARLHSQSSRDTIETRFNETSTPQPHRQGSPSPLATPPLGSQPSPSLSALNSPTTLPQQMSYPGPPTPGFNIDERDPLIGSTRQQTFRPTKFSENLNADPETTTREDGSVPSRPASMKPPPHPSRSDELYRDNQPSYF
ncbi:MAG: hypothetical protein Q9219_003581 [cf. Caloplaca sp. 3 TL-2023]